MARNTKRSLTASPEGLNLADRGLLRFGSKTALSVKLGISRSVISNFFNRKPVSREYFHQICRALSLRSEDVAEKEGQPSSQPEPKEISDNQAIETMRKAYARKYKKQHGHFKVLRMREPIPLEDVYTSVKLLDRDEIEDYMTPDALEKVFRGENRFYRESNQRLNGLEVAKAKQYLTVVGGPGAGKSTFLRKVGLEALKGRGGYFQLNRLPVFLELKRFSSTEIEIESLIADEFRECGLTEPERFVRGALRSGQFLVLLDGLDEVPSSNLNHVVEKIQDFVGQYSDNWFISSCRTAAYRNCGGLKQFTDITIAEFDDAQIEQFTKNWFRSKIDCEAGTADIFLESLNRSENKSAKELARTPLLLTFLCLVYDRSQNLITNRAALYGKALDILLEEWAAHKRIQHENIYKGFHPRLEKVLLSEIACKSFAEDRLFLSEERLLQEISVFLAETLDAPKHLDGKKVLNAIEVQQGILVERIAGFYSFSHLTLQEYLTARYIAQDSERIQQLVEYYLHNPRWKEVFLLVAGLLDKGDKFLNLIIDSQLKSPPPRKLMEWIEISVENNSTNTNSLVDRVRALNRALNLALDLEDRAQIRDLALVQDLALTLDLAPAPAQELETIDLSYRKYGPLSKCLETYILLVNCKKASVRVTPTVWENIQNRMLRPLEPPHAD